MTESSHNKGTLVCLTLIVVATVAACITLVEQKRANSQSHDIEIAKPTLNGFSDVLWYLPNDDLLGFVEIPAGEFIMGSDPAQDRFAYANERWSDRQKQGRVDVETFYIARFETTNAQYTQYLITRDRSDNVTELAINLLPAVNVTWAESIAYCQWLEDVLKNSTATPSGIKSLLANGYHVTLPDEAQWEKAARNSDGRVYPWGNQASTQFANFQAKGPLPVGSKNCASCSYGLQDMSGNVWELTRSFYLPYPFDPQQAPDPSADALMIMRGGSFADGPNNARAATRGGVDPGARNGSIGFRIVLSADK